MSLICVEKEQEKISYDRHEGAGRRENVIYNIHHITRS